MESALAIRIEQCVARSASVSLALGCAYAVYMTMDRLAAYPVALACASTAAAIGFLASSRVLDLFDPVASPLQAPPFDVLEISPEPLEELLLTDRYEPETKVAEPLELDDILAELGPDSRVVRLFDAHAMPTPAQLKSRIDAHLNRSSAHATLPDASEALHEALAELRRSMR